MNLKWILNIYVKPKTAEFLEENRKESLYNLELNKVKYNYKSMVYK